MPIVLKRLESNEEVENFSDTYSGKAFDFSEYYYDASTKGKSVLHTYIDTINSFIKNSLSIEQNYIIGYYATPEHIDEVTILMEALLIENPKDRYEFIYDSACNYLDSKFSQCNYCDFCNDKCIADRETSSSKLMGCCHSYELKSFFGIPIYKNERVCEHLINKTCETKNISCKLFTCKYLKNKGIKFNPNNILYLDYFFNMKQKDIIRFNFFKTKEEIIDKLLIKDLTPYIWWLFTRKYKI